MKIASVPPKISVGSRHRVLFLEEQAFEELAASLNNIPRLRFEHLPSKYLTAALMLCRSATARTTSFTFASTGDLGSNQLSYQGRNCVSAHIVERRQNDFVPNNQIYYKLRKDFSENPQLEWLRAMQMGTCTFYNAQQLDYYETNISLPLLPKIQPSSIVECEQKNLAISSKLDELCLSPTFTFLPFTNQVMDTIAFSSTRFVVLVNLKPAAPGHLLIVPKRIVSSVHDFCDEDCKDWGYVLRKTVDTLTTLYPFAAVEGFSIAIQYGKEAGQTVWHQHTHVIPFSFHSKLAGEPERDEETQERKPPRTSQEMRKECEELRKIFYRSPSL